MTLSGSSSLSGLKLELPNVPSFHKQNEVKQ
jgi:hypothetical protein